MGYGAAMRLITVWILLATMASILAACGAPPGQQSWPEVRSNDTFVVTDGSTLVVDNFNGSVKVSGSEYGNRISVATDLRRPDRLTYEAVQSGNTVTITARGVGLWANHFPRGRRATIEVTVPRNLDVQVKADNGAITLRDVTGTVELATYNGAIKVADVAGEYDITTANGKIEVDDGKGAFRIRTSNGGIRFEGELAHGTSNQFKTSNGNITTLLEGKPVSLSVDAQTSNGDIVMGPALPVASAVRHNNRLSAVIGDGNTDLTLATSNGSIFIE